MGCAERRTDSDPKDFYSGVSFITVKCYALVMKMYQNPTLSEC